MRRSIWRSLTDRETRPSCGIRCSVMSMSPMTLSRLTTAAAMLGEAVEASCMTPSIRNMILRAPGFGSMWMSEARSFSAWRMSRLT